MEARWHGKEYEDALACSVPMDVDMSAYDCQVVAALLAAYYDYYGPIETCAKINPEIPFSSELEGAPFTNEGVLDGLGSLTDGRSAIIESKTTGDSVAPDSDFWMRLRFNMQVLNYVIESRKHGWDPSVIIYDVTRKPSIRPKEVNNLDPLGRPIVLDQSGNRVIIQRGKNKDEPKKSADSKKGERIKSHVETPDEFSDRLYQDALARPEFYFARREVPIIEQDVYAFELQRYGIAKAILHYKECERGPSRYEDQEGNSTPIRDADAWPRNVSPDTCDFCQFKSFCLQNIPPTDEFQIQSFNPELERNTNDTETAIEENPYASAAD